MINENFNSKSILIMIKNINYKSILHQYRHHYFYFYFKFYCLIIYYLIIVFEKFFDCLMMIKGGSRHKNWCMARVLSFLIRYFSNYYTLHRSDLATRAATLDPRLYLSCLSSEIAF